MTQIYRTTKIPSFYFKEIEDYLTHSGEFVSVSEFIRDSIKEKLSRIKNKELTNRYFLIAKDVAFNEETITKVHNRVINKKVEASNALMIIKTVSIQSIIDRSADLDYLRFLSKFLVNFAYVHPLKDGNKRTSWTTADIFLRLNNKKLDLKAESKRETKDELFIWNNSLNKKTPEQVLDFLKKHIVDYRENTEDIDKEIEKSIKENKILLKKLAR